MIDSFPHPKPYTYKALNQLGEHDIMFNGEPLHRVAFCPKTSIENLINAMNLAYVAGFQAAEKTYNQKIIRAKEEFHREADEFLNQKKKEKSLETTD